MSQHGLELTTSYLDRMCDILKVGKHEQLFLGIGNKKIKLTDALLDSLIKHKQPKDGASKWRKFVPSFISGDSRKAKKDVKQGGNANETTSASSALNLIPGTELGDDGKIRTLSTFNKKETIFITEDNIDYFVFEDCCNIIPGDDVLGYIDSKGRIKIHQRDCHIAARLKSGYGNRIVDAKWNMRKTRLFVTSIHVRGIDRIGLLNDVTHVFSSELQLNIMKVNIDCMDGIFDAHFSFRIHDREEVANIINRLKQISDLQEISQE